MNKKRIINCKKQKFDRQESCFIFHVKNVVCLNEYCLYNKDKKINKNSKVFK